MGVFRWNGAGSGEKDDIGGGKIGGKEGKDGSQRGSSLWKRKSRHGMGRATVRAWVNLVEGIGFMVNIILCFSFIINLISGLISERARKGWNVMKTKKATCYK